MFKDLKQIKDYSREIDNFDYMKYKKTKTIEKVRNYVILNNNLVYTRGENASLYINQIEYKVDEIYSFYFFNDKIYVCDIDGTYYECDIENKTVEKSKNVVIHYIIKDYFINEVDENNFDYYDIRQNLIFSSNFHFSLIQDNIGVMLAGEGFVPKEEVVVCRLPDTKLWQFPLSSLGGTQYEPDKTDTVNKILGIVHGNLWIYTEFNRIVAIDIKTGDKIFSFGCFGVYLDERTNNIFSLGSNMFIIIDTQTLKVKEKCNFLESDPDGMGAYKNIFHPLHQGDYFTFLGEKKGDRRGIGWVGLYDYKARKLVWEYEVIPQEERDATRNHLVIPSPAYMSDNKLYVKDVQENLHIFERED